jgi:hypothetical protein
MTLQTLFRKAMQEHKAGDVASAKTLYEQILFNDPYDADALNLLGVLSLQCGDLTRARDLIQRAIDAVPGIAVYHHNLGQVFNKSGDVYSARACYQQSLALDPDLEIAQDQLNALDTAGADIETHGEHLRKKMMRYEVIQHVIDKIKGRTYLEIGVDSGESFVNTRAARKIGVDPVPTSQLIDQLLNIFNIDYFSFSSAGTPQSSELQLTASSKQAIAQMPFEEAAELFYMTSDSFFMEKAQALFYSQKIDVAFVDGLHTYEQTSTDVLNILEHLNDTGVILMHDCNPPISSSAAPAGSWDDALKLNLPGWSGMWCGDVWKSIVQLRATRDDLNIFVLDCDFGIGVVSKGRPSETLDYTVDQIKAMTFDDLNGNRNALLNLKPQKYLFEFLATIPQCR